VLDLKWTKEGNFCHVICFYLIKGKLGILSSIRDKRTKTLGNNGTINKGRLPILVDIIVDM